MNTYIILKQGDFLYNFRCRTRIAGGFMIRDYVANQSKDNNKKDLTSDDVRSQHGGGLGIRTLATVTRPNDLANRPLQPLE